MAIIQAYGFGVQDEKSHLHFFFVYHVLLPLARINNSIGSNPSDDAPYSRPIGMEVEFPAFLPPVEPRSKRRVTKYMRVLTPRHGKPLAGLMLLQYFGVVREHV